MVSDILAEHGILFLGSRLKRLADRMQVDAADVLERLDLGVQPSQVTLLAALDRYGPLSVGDATEALGISQPAVTRLVATLVEAGLVTADRGTRDQRQKTIGLTDGGRALLVRIKSTLWPPVRAAAEALTADLSGSFLRQVGDLEANLARRSLGARVDDARAATAPIADLRVVEFSDALAPAFAEITREWVEGFFAIEDNDRRIIDDPRGTIIDRGGFILFVEAEGLGIVGTCALIKIEDGVFELTKMGVKASARGRKAGAFLLDAVLKRAEAMGLDELFLLTNAKLGAAVHLYEKAGFRHDAGIMRRFGGRYARCDVAMKYPLRPKHPARPEAILRPARGADDLAAVAQLFRDYAEAIGVDLSSQNFEDEVAGLPGAYAPPRGELFLAADRDGTPVGCAGLRALKPGKRCELKRLFVRPGVQGAGLGRRLLEAALDAARAAGYREMVLDCLPQLEAAIALYEHAGFVRTAPYWNNVIPGAIYFSKNLTSIP